MSVRSEAQADAHIVLSQMGLNTPEIYSIRRDDVMDGDGIRREFTIVRETWRDASGLVRISTTHVRLDRDAQDKLLAVVSELDTLSNSDNPFLFDSSDVD